MGTAKRVALAGAPRKGPAGGGVAETFIKAQLNVQKPCPLHPQNSRADHFKKQAGPRPRPHDGFLVAEGSSSATSGRQAADKVFFNF